MSSKFSFCESLEDRKLLAAFVANINFQPAKVPAPAGYVADTGATYGTRDNGMTYGWNADESKQMRFHKTRLATDARFETTAVTRLATRRRAADIAGEAQARAVGIAGELKGRGGEVTDKVKASIDAASETAKDTIARARSSARETATAAPEAARKVIGDNAALIGSLGVALGAIIAASLPDSKAEAAVIGKASDGMKRAAGKAAQSSFETAKDAVLSAADAAAKSVSDADLGKHASRMTHDASDRLTEAADDIVTAAFKPQAKFERESS